MVASCSVICFSVSATSVICFSVLGGDFLLVDFLLESSISTISGLDALGVTPSRSEPSIFAIAGSFGVSIPLLSAAKALFLSKEEKFS